MPPDDTTRLGDMLDAARTAAEFIAGHNRDDLDANRLLQFGLVRALEIIGEAASNVSPLTRAMLPSIPWADIVRMRNRLIHVYFKINLDIVWNTAVDDVPVLIAELADYLGDNSGEEQG